MNKVGSYMGICFLAITKSFLANYADFVVAQENIIYRFVINIFQWEQV